MLRARVVVRQRPIEVEAETKLKLEEALEAVFNFAARMESVPPQKAYREPETQAEKESVSTPAPQEVTTAGPGIHEGDPPTPIYEGAAQIADYVYIAFKDLASKYGEERGFSYRELLKHLQDTGGDILIRDNKEPISSVRQAIKHSPMFRKNEEGLVWLQEPAKPGLDFAADFQPSSEPSEVPASPEEFNLEE